jgi:hypothetical protein
MLEHPRALVLETRDVFGHEYAADLYTDVIAESGDVRVTRRGGVALSMRTHEVLLPVAPVTGPSGTLPHMMGVHAYVTLFSDEEFFALDLRVHNALSGLDLGDSRDDALSKLYFEKLELCVPQGWTAYADLTDPHLGTPYSGSGRSPTGSCTSSRSRASSSAGSSWCATAPRRARCRSSAVEGAPSARPE